MELKGKDLYRIENVDFLNASMIRSLFLLYQPMIGTNAVSFYMTLYTESELQKTFDTHQRLSLLLNLNIEEIEKCRIKLEEYMLLETYVLEKESGNRYLYSLKKPFSEEDFMNNRNFMLTFASAVGQKQLELTLGRIGKEQVSKEEYRNITTKVSRAPQKRNLDLNVEYTKVKPRYEFSDKDTTIVFDYDAFFKTTSTLVFPAELRTEENLYLIGKLATVHGLSVDRMRLLVTRCVNMKEMKFNSSLLKTLAQKATPEITTAKDPYLLPPVSFLQAKQRGVSVSLGDRKLLEELSLRTHFSNEVINVLIEYVLKVSDNRLVPAFVEMVASEWARDGVTSREDAFKATKKRKQSRSYKEKPMPEYMNQVEQKPETKASKEDLDKIQSLLQEMKEKNGKV